MARASSLFPSYNSTHQLTAASPVPLLQLDELVPWLRSQSHPLRPPLLPPPPISSWPDPTKFAARAWLVPAPSLPEWWRRAWRLGNLGRGGRREAGSRGWRPARCRRGRWGGGDARPATVHLQRSNPARPRELVWTCKRGQPSVLRLISELLRGQIAKYRDVRPVVFQFNSKDGENSRVSGLCVEWY